MALTDPTATDLNALLPPRRKVKFGDATYEVPGDMPMEVYLRMQAAFGGDDEQEATAQLRQAFIDLLTFYHEGDVSVRTQVERDLRPVGVRTIILLLNGIYKDADDEEESDVIEGKASAVEQESTTEAATPTTTGTSPSEPSPTLSYKEAATAATTG